MVSLSHHSNLMTKQEAIAWRRWATKSKIRNDDSTVSQKIRRTTISIQKGWLTEDPEILKLLKNGIEEFERNVAIRIDKTNFIDYNNCPKCNRLARTPKAQQCRFCSHDWH